MFFVVCFALEGDLVEAAFLKDVLAEIVTFVVPSVPKPFRKPVPKDSKNGPQKSNEQNCFWNPFSDRFWASWESCGPILEHLLAVIPPFGPQDPTKEAQDRQRQPQDSPTQTKAAPRQPQDGPRQPQDRPETAPGEAERSASQGVDCFRTNCLALAFRQPWSSLFLGWLVTHSFVTAFLHDHIHTYAIESLCRMHGV